MLKKTSSGLCSDCTEFPCVRLKNIDKRYQGRYRTSLIQNLKTLRATDPDIYIQSENDKWTCKMCGSVLSVHGTRCLKCEKEY